MNKLERAASVIRQAQRTFTAGEFDRAMAQLDIVNNELMTMDPATAGDDVSGPPGRYATDPV